MGDSKIFNKAKAVKTIHLFPRSRLKKVVFFNLYNDDLLIVM